MWPEGGYGNKEKPILRIRISVLWLMKDLRRKLHPKYTVTPENLEEIIHCQRVPMVAQLGNFEFDLYVFFSFTKSFRKTTIKV